MYVVDIFTIPFARLFRAAGELPAILLIWPVFLPSLFARLFPTPGELPAIRGHNPLQGQYQFFHGQLLVELLPRAFSVVADFIV